MMSKLFLDDERMPPDYDWIVVRSFDEGVGWLLDHPEGPNFISFDHDLGDGPSGQDFAVYLVGLDLSSNGKYLPKDFDFKVHSANIIGGENIEKYLRQYLDLKQQGLT